jgi:hypothetical protein
MARDVEQDAAPCDPAPRDCLYARRSLAGSVDGRRRDPVVEPVPRVRDVTEPVPLARALEIELIEDVVASDAAPS